MSDFLLNWETVNIDGANTLSGAGETLGVTISTPSNVDGDNWAIGDVGGDTTLKSSSVDDPTKVQLDFSEAVENVTFQIYDIDSGSGWDDQIKIVAVGPDGNEVTVQFSDLHLHTVNGNTIEGAGNDNPGVEGPGALDSVTVTIPGPIQWLKVFHDDGDSSDCSGTVGFGDISFDMAPDHGPVDGTTGDDVMLPGYVDLQNDTIDGADGDDDEVYGYEGNDVIAGGAGTNTLFGGTGDDVFIGGEGADIFYGGADQDNLDYSNSDAAVNVNLSTGALSGGHADNDTIGGGIDGVIGSDYNDTLIGFDHEGTSAPDVFTNEFFGGDGDDYIEGKGGDDYIEGGNDDDEIYGGVGEDEIYGGNGADYIEAGADNDVIYGGDNGTGGTTTVRESFEWNEQSDFANDGSVANFTQDTGNVDVTFSILNETGATDTTYETDTQNVSGIDADGNPVDASSSLSSILNGSGNDGDYQLAFSDEVENVSFRINDVDGDGIVNVKAYDMAGNQIEISMVGGANLTLSDTDGIAGADTADSNGGYLADSSGEYSVLIDIPGPVGRIVIEHDQDGSNNSGINVTDVYYDVTVADASVDEGDTIYGGSGDDLAFGGAGNDSIYSGSGNDTLHGDAGDDTLCGIDGDDTLYGGDGNDLLEGMNDDDTLFGEDGNDRLYGGSGSDTLDGGAGADTIKGGSDQDRINVMSAAEGFGDFVDGGTNGVDEDTLDLTNVGPFRIINETVDADGDSTSGTVEFLDPTDGTVLGTMDFTEIETIIGTPINPDGTVHGTAGDDLMQPGYVDPQNDTIDGADGDDDIIEAGAGNDTVQAGNGNDTVFGGEGNDTLSGNDGDDTLYGEDGNDRLFGGDGFDSLYGGAGDDTLSGNRDGDLLDGGDGNDTLNGDIAADTLYGGDDDDLIRGENGDDLMFGGDGGDTADGGDGNDTINTSGPVDFANDIGTPDRGYPGLYNDDADPTNDMDTVFGGGGSDTITTGDDADSIDGGTGNDVIYSGVDDDSITGGAGDDTIVAGEGQDNVDGGTGDDLIYGGLEGVDVLDIPDALDLRPDNGLDTLSGGDGNDTIFGADDDDLIYGGNDNDVIYGGIDDDTMYGDAGEDYFEGGEGSDTAYGGDDADRFVVTSVADANGDVVDGGTGGDDNDVLDLTGLGPFQIVGETVDADGDSTSGTIQFLDAPGGSVIGSMEFSEIETIVPCFTPGTLIATMEGEKLVETLKVGDRIITRDNGAQEIRWLGSKPMTGTQLQANPHLQPVLVRKGSLGAGLPERDMLVSPNHRVLVNNAEVGLLFNEPEVLVAAKHLVDVDKGIVKVAASSTTYVHFMFDHHEVVLSNGAWTESFQPGDQAMVGVSGEQRDEITELFPELANAQGREAYASSRLSLKAFEAKMLK